MGLDNIPLKYPCRTQGTASTTSDGTVDCTATQENGGCPWANATDRPEDGRVLGMLGTDCWYRGAHGEYILAILNIDQDGITFYGDNEDGSVKSATSCHAVSDAISQTLKDTSDSAITERLEETDDPVAVEEFRAKAQYAAWWMNWAAREAGGAACWY